MKSNELRVGNYIYYGQSIRHITTIHDSPSRKCVGVDNMLTELDIIQPISLTPEILEKAGFEKCGKESMKIGIKNNDYIEIDYVQNIAVITDYKDGLLLAPYQQPLYLHQLQNLYFALTGEELPIEL
jgi:hypothetical protein